MLRVSHRRTFITKESIENKAPCKRVVLVHSLARLKRFESSLTTGHAFFHSMLMCVIPFQPLECHICYTEGYFPRALDAP